MITETKQLTSSIQEWHTKISIVCDKITLKNNGRIVFIPKLGYSQRLISLAARGYELEKALDLTLEILDMVHNEEITLLEGMEYIKKLGI
jgi:hypothetical protein